MTEEGILLMWRRRGKDPAHRDQGQGKGDRSNGRGHAKVGHLAEPARRFILSIRMPVGGNLQQENQRQ